MLVAKVFARTVQGLELVLRTPGPRRPNVLPIIPGSESQIQELPRAN